MVPFNGRILPKKIKKNLKTWLLLLVKFFACILKIVSIVASEAAIKRREL